MASKTDFPGVALVTGAASGIGAAVTHAFAVAGCTKIILLDNNSDALISAEEKLRAVFKDLDTCCVKVDISEEGAVERNVSSAINNEAFGGRLDYVVNCAGVNGINATHPPTNSSETSVEWFDTINGINYRGTWMSNRAFLSIMMKQKMLDSHDGVEKRRQRGAIVNMSSGLGVVGMPKNPVYSASKAAIISLTRSDAIDYSEHRIRVNCVCPGLIDTPMTNSMGGMEAMQGVVDSTPLKRLGMAEEIADACVWLCSTRASWVQGQSLIVDGGIVLL